MTTYLAAGTKGYSYYTKSGSVWHKNIFKEYGVKLQGNGDIIGICLDQNEGILKFIINGYDFGNAFKDADLKTGEWFPAVSPYNKDDDICFLPSKD